MEQLQLLLVSLGMSNMSRPVGGTVAFSWRPRPAPNDINVLSTVCCLPGESRVLSARAAPWHHGAYLNDTADNQCKQELKLQQRQQQQQQLRVAIMDRVACATWGSNRFIQMATKSNAPVALYTDPPVSRSKSLAGALQSWRVVEGRSGRAEKWRSGRAVEADGD
ncbi:hypothetical protein ACLKA6_003575 [Drosophila palustris]